MSAEAWSALGSMLAACGTVFTFAVGLVLFGIQLRDRHRAHASLVAVWASVFEEDGESGLRLNIHNGGQQPVYAVVIQDHRDGLLEAALWGPLWRMGALAPNETMSHFYPVRTRSSGDPGMALARSAASWKWSVAFTDCAGRSWRRDSEGNLRRQRLPAVDEKYFAD